MSLLNKFRKQPQKKSHQEQVLEHLCDLLNTKKNFGAYPQDYGIDSYVYIGSDKKIINQVIADIKYCLNKFEKRIHLIDIQNVPNLNRFLLSFIISCRIEQNTYSFRLSFHHQKNLFNFEVTS